MARPAAQTVPGRRPFDRGLLVVCGLALLAWLALLPRFLNRLDPLTGDEPFYVMTAISLLQDGDLDESNNYTQRDYEQFYPPDPLPPGWQGWPSFPRELPPHPAHSRLPGLHTKHGLGLTLLIALPWAALGRLGAVLVPLACGVLLAGQMFLLARESGAPPGVAGTVALGLALAMPVGPYALLLFPEVPAALCLIYAVRRLAAPANRPWQWLLAGGAIGFLPWLHQRFVFTAAVLGLVALGRWLRARPRWPVTLAIAPALVGGLAILSYNLWLYGTPWQNPRDHAGFNGLAGALNGAAGLLLDAQWGLWVVAPVTILAVAALPWWLEAERRSFWIALAAVAPYLALMAAYKVWWGEWGPPARYLVPVVPLVAAPLGAWLAHARWPGWLATALLWGWGAMLTAIGYLDPQRFYHHPDGVNKLVGVVSGRLGVDLGRWLVPFQPYAQAPLDERVLAALVAAVALLLAVLLVGSPERVARSPGQPALETP